MEIYVLREDMYHDWAMENGACDLIGVYDNKEIAINKFMSIVNAEQEQGYYIDDSTLKDDIQSFICNGKTAIYVDVYCIKGGYENGNNYGTVVLSTRFLNDKEQK